jgi:hypothetical protein
LGRPGDVADGSAAALVDVVVAAAVVAAAVAVLVWCQLSVELAGGFDIGCICSISRVFLEVHHLFNGVGGVKILGRLIDFSLDGRDRFLSQDDVGVYFTILVGKDAPEVANACSWAGVGSNLTSSLSIIALIWRAPADSALAPYVRSHWTRAASALLMKYSSGVMPFISWWRDTVVRTCPMTDFGPALYNRAEM